MFFVKTKIIHAMKSHIRPKVLIYLRKIDFNDNGLPTNIFQLIRP
jgi:hypothetical protein